MFVLAGCLFTGTWNSSFFCDYSLFSVIQHQVLFTALEKVTPSQNKSIGSVASLPHFGNCQVLMMCGYPKCAVNEWMSWSVCGGSLPWLSRCSGCAGGRAAGWHLPGPRSLDAPGVTTTITWASAKLLPHGGAFTLDLTTDRHLHSAERQLGKEGSALLFPDP